MLRNVLISFSLTTFVSVLVGLIFINHFWSAFAFTFLVQVIVFYIVNTIIQTKALLKVQQLQTDQIKELSKQKAILECPCAEKSRQEVDMRFDQDIVYQCSKCKKSIKADVNVKTVLVTNPIYFNDRT